MADSCFDSYFVGLGGCFDVLGAFSVLLSSTEIAPKQYLRFADICMWLYRNRAVPVLSDSLWMPAPTDVLKLVDELRGNESESQPHLSFSLSAV